MKRVKYTGQYCECGKELTYSDLRSSKLFAKTLPKCEQCVAFGLLVDVNEFHRVLELNSRIKRKRRMAKVVAREYAQSLQQLSMFVS